MGLSMTSGCLLKVFKTQSQDHVLGVGHVLLQDGQNGVELAVRGTLTHFIDLSPEG